MTIRLLLLLTTILLLPQSIADDHSDAQKAVLVTGASSGIGLNITQHLAKAGYYVYAGARKAADLERLNAMDNVTAVKLDVTVQEQIDAAAEFVKSQGRGLYGIINNAGVGTFANSLSEAPMDDMVWMHDINVFGPHRINLAFMPQLKESKGRTATIGSISGYLASPRSGIYSMTKMGVEVYAEALDAELQTIGMHAANIAPGGYKSKIREKVVMHTITGKYDMKSDDTKLSEEQQKQLQEMRESNDAMKEPDEVSEVVLAFLAAEEPKVRYMVTPNKEQAMMTVTSAMRRLTETNADQPYSLSRDELIKLMDEVSQ